MKTRQPGACFWRFTTADLAGEREGSVVIWAKDEWTARATFKSFWGGLVILNVEPWKSSVETPEKSSTATAANAKASQRRGKRPQIDWDPQTQRWLKREGGRWVPIMFQTALAHWDARDAQFSATAYSRMAACVLEGREP